MSNEPTIRRRHFLKVLGVSGGALAATAGCAVPRPGAASPATAAAAPPLDRTPEGEATAPSPERAVVEPPLTLNATEYAFLEAAVETLIPEDELSPSGREVGVAVFIDRQLAGAFGTGARTYRNGPFLRGKPEHGYQLALTPLELFRSGVGAVNAWTTSQHGQPFDGLSEAERASSLSLLETGNSGLALGQVFFELLLSLTMEGFFADPVYGGNRDKAGWKMVGFPGLPATYQRDIVAYHDKPYDRPARSIQDFS